MEGIPQAVMDKKSTNLPEAWRKFQQHAQLILSGPLKSKNEEEQCFTYFLGSGEKVGPF